MVGMMQTFGNCEVNIPHGGPPFQGWRKGFGFGHAAGAGNHVLHPTTTQELRFTPKDDRGLASSAFWRKKNELGRAASFGIGERPDYGNPRDGDVGPDTYGDVAPALSRVRRNHSREHIKMKPRFPSTEEKARDMSWPATGPGPAKYNTCSDTGKSSWNRPAKLPSWSLGPKSFAATPDEKEGYSRPPPGAYDIITRPGQNSPILRGTLYDITLQGRTKLHKPGAQTPGPGTYKVQGELEKYSLAQKIAAVKVPKKQDDSMEESSAGAWTTEDIGPTAVAGGEEETGRDGDAITEIQREGKKAMFKRVATSAF
mmetsp:Transcript_1207/g.2460  ORF Transcript_1207/g.2460 Transcript_1207/m.2460 type:complete len:313 (-) Transcript_1207:156-1094(-)|eukprot:CAMPEP_0197653162 /NCGR_PEP_ID=MMETSP1338-20131121/34892_1 /TAXON_ID=43686 ORGANISM="Pelagodinium beii, Strain RCC1491" /NCGR_SAMPLE_ID=MMETSP1338 /ASSEMBLY_ACC=CAM_ASM_000754 /LENGTH=312 /DNA_ID=CAMNT_0043228193 /DNA_START=84 /DNA_END=1022 /DNA_ORIENTATION=+